MGIGNTVKQMFKDEVPGNEAEENLRRRTSRGSRLSTGGTDPVEKLNDPASVTKLTPKVPIDSGTTATEGLQSDVTTDQGLETMRNGRDIAGLGTDAAAAHGGSLAGTHQGARISSIPKGSDHLRESGTYDTLGGKDIRVGPTSSTAFGSPTGQPMGGSKIERTDALSSGESKGHLSSSHHVGQTGILDHRHDSGHAKRDVMPTGDTMEDTTQLNPVTHEHVRHLETEDVQKLKERERHIHHVQHHTQPVTVSETLPEVHRENIHPVTRIEEQHANKVEDNTLFLGQVNQHRDSKKHMTKERTIVDKGTAVTEHVHHHIHHVIQPVIEKETVDRQFIHTKIPIHEVTHEAPIVHQSQTHAPIPLEHFVERGGVLKGGISQADISAKVLHGGECTREIDGVAQDLEKELNLSGSKMIQPEEPKYITTKVTKRTTTTVEPQTAIPAARN
ncbi:hypothetical protein EST38_g8585 [Candolleomyces aberdarensis]|uniref:Allergen n=1 Tax=Candolleomyces aberdarensis TaxID=2316362 RepID=A0A4Q2DE94_9AGAR|nr:hypothetical protein EST38_g8585 [Candolleomyces aberdarensis]